MGNREWDSNEGREDIRAKGGPQEGNNTIIPRYPSRRVWREIEDSRVDCQKLLVARSNERGGKIHG